MDLERLKKASRELEKQTKKVEKLDEKLKSEKLTLDEMEKELKNAASG